MLETIRCLGNLTQARIIEKHATSAIKLLKPASHVAEQRHPSWNACLSGNLLEAENTSRSYEEAQEKGISDRLPGCLSPGRYAAHPRRFGEGKRFAMSRFAKSRTTRATRAIPRQFYSILGECCEENTYRALMNGVKGL